MDSEETRRRIEELARKAPEIRQEIDELRAQREPLSEEQESRIAHVSFHLFVEREGGPDCGHSPCDIGEHLDEAQAG